MVNGELKYSIEIAFVMQELEKFSRCSGRDEPVRSGRRKKLAYFPKERGTLYTPSCVKVAGKRKAMKGRICPFVRGDINSISTVAVVWRIQRVSATPHTNPGRALSR